MQSITLIVLDIVIISFKKNLMENKPSKILIAGVGNELRQDDAFGVLLAKNYGKKPTSRIQ